MEAIIFANVAGYMVVAAGGLLIGTMFGGKFTAAVMSTVHGLEGRISTIEGAATASKATTVIGTGKHAAAIEAHAAAVTKLAGAIEKHAAAVDDHGAATVAAAVENNAAATVAASK